MQVMLGKGTRLRGHNHRFKYFGERCLPDHTLPPLSVTWCVLKSTTIAYKLGRELEKGQRTEGYGAPKAQRNPP